MKGYFISFEGPDGCGKTSIVKELISKLEVNFSKVNFVMTREPGGNNNVIAEDIRNIVLNKMDYQIVPRAEALLFAASRAQHVDDFILPHLNKGDVVLCDRFIDSSLIYQGIGRKLGFEKVLEINEFATKKTYPDLTILLLVKPEVGLQRIQKDKKREINRLDEAKLHFHQENYEGYLTLAKTYPKRIIEVDANGSFEKVLNDTYLVVVKKLNEWFKAHE